MEALINDSRKETRNAHVSVRMWDSIPSDHKMYGVANMTYNPELRSIPLTYMNCEYFDSPLCRFDGKDPFKHVNLNGWLCSMLRENGYCPKGFQ